MDTRRFLSENLAVTAVVLGRISTDACFSAVLLASWVQAYAQRRLIAEPFCGRGGVA